MYIMGCCLCKDEVDEPALVFVKSIGTPMIINNERTLLLASLIARNETSYEQLCTV